ncbi:XRCC4-like factor-domain-containing protein [Apodospora peruviana]|uniref:Non-homologous end-joining factor 1 n=1 Tax=Apodospora peruviana TaxID=516989 RepID=A0AAE0ME37_9PEZI|nr:XRCC4-like factor-domain-containing protein [Apodospora peruviana]
MPGHASWRPLSVAVPGIPNLLVSAAFTAESYNVHITDLANLWVESMDRKPIVKRGLVEDTSIDPSDGPDQIRRMLELLRAAFDMNDPEHPNTSLTLGQDSRSGVDSLVIHVTCILPKPLKPFKWPMHLTKCPQSTLATELVLPLIQAHEARSREIDLLMAALKEKDGVIGKLIENLEANGTGLEQVFNALSGKRRVTRETADGKVKGLAPFSEADFRSGSREGQSATRSPDVQSLLDSVFVDTGLKYKSDLDLEASSTLDDWWTKLGKGKQVVLVDNPRAKIPESAPSPPTPGQRAEADDDDDDFQVQATPPGLSSVRKRGTHTRPVVPDDDDDEISDGEDDSEIPDSLPPSSKTIAPSKSSGSRLGAIGGRKNLGSSTPPRPTQRSGETADESDTASEPDEDDDADPPPPPSPPKPVKRGGKLGRIGGKSARSPSPEPPVEEKPSSQPARRHKLGTIGKKTTPSAQASTSHHAESGGSDDDRGRKSKTPVTAGGSRKERPRETSQERADRKRVELERELERKVAAGPVKKKHKF